MKNTHIEALIRDFPHLYRNAREGKESAMYWGFAIGDGWFPILYELSAKIEALALAGGLDPKSRKWPAATTVKEKFGHLRYHLQCSTDLDFQKLIKEAAAKAAVTCELCGKPGHMFTANWYYVRCDKCEARKDEIYEERDAEYRAQEALGGFRRIYDDAFAELDAAAAVSMGKHTSSGKGSKGNLAHGAKNDKADDEDS